MKLRNKMLWAGCLSWLVGISQICAQDYPARGMRSIGKTADKTANTN